MNPPDEVGMERKKYERLKLHYVEAMLGANLEKPPLGAGVTAEEAELELDDFVDALITAAQPSHQQQPVEEVFGWVWRVIGQIRWYFCMGAERPNLGGFGQCDCIPVYRRRVTEETSNEP